MAITKIYKGALERSDIQKIYKGTTLLYEKVLPPQGETWVINESPNATFSTFSIEFTSNNEEYTDLIFDLNFIFNGSIWYGYSKEVYNGSHWTNEAYRTITFETAPTGDLLTWLQANAVKQ